MTEFMQKECYRLIDKLAETDPTTEAYHIVLSSIERLDAIGTTIDEIAKMREGKPVVLNVVVDEAAAIEQLKKMTVEAPTPPPDPVVPFEAPDFPEEAKDDLVKQDSAKTYSASEVRKALVEARGKGTDVKAILAKVGADNFTAVPEAKYGELMSLLGA